MTPEHEKHLEQIKQTFLELVDTKYRAGQEEHGGNLFNKDGLLDFAIEEVLDLAVYLFTLKQQKDGLYKVQKGLKDDQTTQRSTQLTSCLNI